MDRKLMALVWNSTNAISFLWGLFYSWRVLSWMR